MRARAPATEKARIGSPGMHAERRAQQRLGRFLASLDDDLPRPRSRGWRVALPQTLAEVGAAAERVHRAGEQQENDQRAASR